MEDTGALGWTEGMSHTQAAQQYVHIEESTHDFIECTQNSHIEERSRKKTSKFIESLRNYTLQKNKCRIIQVAFIRDNGTQAVGLITVQVTCKIDPKREEISGGFLGLDRVM